MQADTIVPDPADPQAYDRYAYVNNNALNYTDPSGHEPCMTGAWGDCIPNSPSTVYEPDNWVDYLQNQLPDVVGVGSHWGVSWFVARDKADMTYYDFEQNVILATEEVAWGIAFNAGGDASGYDIAFGYYDNDRDANTVAAIEGRSAGVVQN